jgi:hypothetical protein
VISDVGKARRFFGGAATVSAVELNANAPPKLLSYAVEAARKWAALMRQPTCLIIELTD